MSQEMRIANHCMKAEMKNIKSEAYECLARERENAKKCHIRKNANQCFREVERRLKRYEDVSMPQLARIKYAEEDHNQSNVVCEEIKAKMKVTSHPVVTIGKLLKK